MSISIVMDLGLEVSLGDLRVFMSHVPTGLSDQVKLVIRGDGEAMFLAIPLDGAPWDLPGQVDMHANGLAPTPLSQDVVHPARAVTTS